MKCPICKYGDTISGIVRKKYLNIGIQGCSRACCNNCSEEYFTNITQSIMKQAESVIAQGVQIDVRQ